MTSSRQKGFSLIELMQTLVIFSLVMAMVFGLFVKIKRTMDQRERRYELFNASQKMAAEVESALKNASGWSWGKPNGICFTGSDDDTVKIVWQARDSMLYWNDKKCFEGNARVTGFQLSFAPGPDSLGLYTAREWFEELDDDRSGVLWGRELNRVKWIKLEMTVAKDAQQFKVERDFRAPPPLIDNTDYIEP
ncbi:prepilin-type N-terminal cleavage/methylation domain-containing protein [candidate division TA06 bacterium]|nr:prepilin-type N-terminal cleavage/methylation domain-containing protein [candidate division TA06 bacterium]